MRRYRARSTPLGWSCFHRPSLQREKALRTALDEEDDEDEHRDLGEHGAGPGFQELVREAEHERGVDRAGELADAAEDDDQERMDDVALAEVRPDISHLRERAAGEAGDAGAEAEGPGVDARGGYADA